MKKLRGPELKMPDLKAPAFLTDLFYDLRDRRLLPLVALVVVAILAVPFLLGDDAEEPLLPTPGVSAVPESGGAKASSLAVVEATPGLRDYRKRLRGRVPTDPFEQQYTEPVAAGGSRSEGASSSSSGKSGSGSVEVEGTDDVVDTAPGSPPGGGSSGGGASPGKIDPDDPGLRFYSFRPDVRFGVAGDGDLKLHEDLPLGEALPEQNPVIVFLGVSEDGKRVAFDVSNEVAMVRGPGRCIGGNQSCSLLILRAGQAVDILTGSPGRAFRLDVVRIDFVEVDRPKGAHSSEARQRWSFGPQSFIK